MNTVEDRIRAATRAAADTVSPGSVPPLRLSNGQDGARRRQRWPLRPVPRGWRGLLTPLAAAAAVAAVVAASLAISAAFHGHARPSGPGPAAQSHPSPAPLRPTALRPAALRQVPRYFAALALTAPVQLIGGEAAVVRSTLTGRVLATVTPPRPCQIFTWVSAAADDRTFVLAAQRYWPIASGQAGMPAQNRDITTPLALFKMAFDPATHTATLARLAVPETIRSDQLAGMTVSPDGARLALDLNRSIQSIQVVTLATGAVRSWVWPGGGWVGNFKPSGQVFSWTADGTTLEFQQWGTGHPKPISIRLLDTTAPGTSLASSKVVLTFPDAGALGFTTLLTPTAPGSSPPPPKGSPSSPSAPETPSCPRTGSSSTGRSWGGQQARPGRTCCGQARAARHSSSPTPAESTPATALKTSSACSPGTRSPRSPTAATRAESPGRRSFNSWRSARARPRASWGLVLQSAATDALTA